MLHTRIYNTFINDFLQGNVPETFSCSAYILNSKYAELADTKYYLKHINDFLKITSGNALYKDNATGLVKGDFVSSGTYIENTYYRDETINEDTSENAPLVICNDNLSAFSGKLLANGKLDDKYKEYIDTYGFFYFVTKNNSFAELAKLCKNKEHFVVVLGDDIDNVAVNGNAFGTSRQHPFRGIFDGNGYTVSISQINANTESNGLFGYIAEDGVVKNLTISNTVFSDSILVNSTVELNIDMIKGGIGDIKCGVLAGSNYGTIKNVILSGSIDYDGTFNPAFYFTENKSSYNNIYSSQWQTLAGMYPEDILEHIPELPDMTNICYPTQLCVNSVANIIPYIGYFAEGAFNRTWGVGESKYKTLVTTLAKARVIWPGNTSEAGYDGAFNYTNYMYDIYKLYVAKHPATNEDDDYFYEDDYVKRTVPGDGASLRGLPQISFRLGPNDKSAYLIGNLVGFNGGVISSAAVVTTATFNSTTVALIGGLAGRDAGGNVSDTYVCTTFAGTSGLYTGKVTVNANEKAFDAVSATFNTGELFNANAYSISVRKSDGTKGTATLTRDALVSVLSAFKSVYTATTDDVIGSLIENKSVDSTFKKYCDAYTIHYSGSNIPENVTVNVTLQGTSDTVPITINEISITPAFLAITAHDTNGYNVGELMTVQKTYSGISAVNGSNVEYVVPNFTAKYPTVMPSATLSYSIPYTSDGVAHTAYYTLNVAIPATAMLNFSAAINLDKLGLPISTHAYTERIERFVYGSGQFDMLLFPILNIGGMFGEYVYSDGQSIKRSRSELYATDFNVTAPEGSASYVTDLSIISLFASNVTFDSALKSNTDFFKDSIMASAYSKLQNTLDCTVQTVNSDTIKQNYTRNCDNIIQNASKIGYIHYLNCYNQIAPALVTTNGSRVEHEKDENHYPDIGIQYTDQLFYEVGLNMGVPAGPIDNFEIEEYEAYSRYYASTYQGQPLSGLYFNYPAQVSSCNAENQTELNRYISEHGNEYKMWFYDKIFNAAYNVGTSTANSTMYVSKQLTQFPTHYPLYRAKASLSSGYSLWGPNASIRLSDYLTVTNKVPVKASTYKGQTPEFGEPSKLVKDAVANIVKENSKSHLDASLINYTYTYSSRNIETTAIKPVELMMNYRDILLDYDTCPKTILTSSFTYSDAADLEAKTIFVHSTANWMVNSLAFVMQHKGYVMSSTSFKNNVHETAPNINVLCKNITEKNTTVKIVDAFEEHEAVAEVVNFKLITSDNCTLQIQNGVNLKADLTKKSDNATVTVSNYYNTTVTDNNIFVTVNPSSPATAHEKNDIYYNTRHVYGTIPATATIVNNHSFVPTTKTVAVSINIDADVTLHEQRSFMLDKYHTLTANCMTYAFIPTSADIINILNANAAQQFTCTGLSANDMRYALIVNSAYKPIMDIELTTTAVENDGYIIEFPTNVEKTKLIFKHVPLISNSATVGFGPATDNDTGVAINIENGNK